MLVYTKAERKEVVMCKATIYEARNNFSALVKRAEGGEPVELTRHEKPVAVIISYEEYKRQKPKKSFIERMAELRKKYADVFEDPTFEGLPVPEDGYDDEKYLKKLDKMWG